MHERASIGLLRDKAGVAKSSTVTLNLFPVGMGPRWSRRGGAVVATGAPGCTGAGRVFTTDRTKYRPWRASKPSLHFVPYPTRWSTAFQTAVLLIMSACMLVYILLTPGEVEEWPKQRLHSVRAFGPSLLNTSDHVLQVSSEVKTQSVEAVSRASNLSSGAGSREEPFRSAGDLEGRRLGRTDFKHVSELSLPLPSSIVPILGVKPKQGLRARTKIQLRLLANTELEVYSDPTSRYYPSPTVCRIFHGCQEGDGTLLLGENMREHMSLLRACGISQVRFEAHKFGVSNGFDLFTNVLRYHMPHLVSDVLSLTYSMSVVGGRYPLETPIPRRSESTRPVVMAQDRIRSMPSGAWTLEMLSRLPYHAKVKTKGELLTTKPLLSAGNETCFRSIVAFDAQIYWQVNSARFGENNALFAQNFLWTRSPRQPAKSQSTCAPVVTVLNRQPDDQRTLANVDKIAEHFENMRKTQKYSYVADASFRVSYMNTSFADQMKTVQDADVILASHGAALANLIFARLQTPVIEVFPFSTYLFHQPYFFACNVYSFLFLPIPLTSEPNSCFSHSLLRQYFSKNGTSHGTQTRVCRRETGRRAILLVRCETEY